MVLNSLSPCLNGRSACLFVPGHVRHCLFGDWAMRLGIGRGHDDYIPRSLAFLRSGGRFLEIGKRGIWSHQHSPQSLRAETWRSLEREIVPRFAQADAGEPPGRDVRKDCRGHDDGTRALEAGRVGCALGKLSTLPSSERNRIAYRPAGLDGNLGARAARAARVSADSLRLVHRHSCKHRALNVQVVSHAAACLYISIRAVILVRPRVDSCTPSHTVFSVTGGGRRFARMNRRAAKRRAPSPGKVQCLPEAPERPRRFWGAEAHPHAHLRGSGGRQPAVLAAGEGSSLAR